MTDNERLARIERCLTAMLKITLYPMRNAYDGVSPEERCRLVKYDEVKMNQAIEKILSGGD